MSFISENEEEEEKNGDLQEQADIANVDEKKSGVSKASS